MDMEYTCNNCGNQFTGKYCNNCGEKIYTEKDKTLYHFFEDGLHFITHFEGTFFTTLKTMVTRPGKLSLDYCDGIRKRYFKPLSLFLLLVILYLLFPYFAGLNMEMKYYSVMPLYGKFASHEISKVMIHTGMSESQLSVLFHEKAEKLSKFLLIIIIPLTALFFKAVLFRRKKYFFDYLVYATEVNAVYLLWGFLILPFLLIFLLWCISFAGIHPNFGDNILGVLIGIPVCIYVIISAKRFFAIKWWQSIITGLLFFVADNLIMAIIYKFILFVITIYQF